MDRSGVGFSAILGDRPKHLIYTTGIGAISVIFTLLGLVWNWSRSDDHLRAFAIGLVLIGGVFWFYFYWNGFSWTRYIVIGSEHFGRY